MSLELISVIVQAITAAAILLAGWQLLYHSRAMHRDLEMAYVVRYWQLMDDRSPQFVLTRTPGPGDDVVIMRYLHLCEDELELRELGRVTDDTWRFWSSAMFDQVSVPAYREMLEKAPDDVFFHLRQLIEVGPHYDPLKYGRVKRRLRGL